MVRLLLLALCLAGFVFAQGPGPGPSPNPDPGAPRWPLFPPELQRYLEPSAAQVAQINILNSQFMGFVARKNVRAAQVQREIREWTSAEQIVPIELGLRYAELEQIQREIRDEEKKTQAAVRAVLTDAQRVKLRVIEEAAKLLPLIWQASAQRLIDPVVSPFPGGIIRADLPIMPLVP